MALRGSEWTIGRLSKETGCNIETIRYYERKEILPSPPRSEGGHRLYDEEHLKRLTFVCRSRELGFSLKQIRELLELVDGVEYACAEVEKISRKHLIEIQKKVSDLKKLEGALKKMVSQCAGGSVPHCPVIDALFAGTC